VLVFAALGLGLAIPFVAIAFVPAFRKRLPSPGPWMKRLQRFLAIPMAATAVAALWLLYRQAGNPGLWVGIAAAAILAIALAIVGSNQKRGQSLPVFGLAVAAISLVGAIALAPEPGARGPVSVEGAETWSEAAVQRELAAGHPVFVYFTADWCLTCKANEAAAINREAVREAFDAAKVKVMAGDWTNGNPAITRFLENRGRAGVPLYLWYRPGSAEAEELPQVLTPSMLISRARQPRQA
jgi:thiol:disulfide interchange protein